MNEHEVFGCGHFSESDWADLFMTAGPDENVHYDEDRVREGRGDGYRAVDGHDNRSVDVSYAASSAETLQAHMQTCAACRAEWRSFASIGFAIRDLVRTERPTREAFVDGVLAASGRAVPGSEFEATRDAKPSSRPDAGIGRAPRSLFRPSPMAVAAVIAAFAVLGAGLWSWPWADEPGLPSTGEVLPGGAIVKSTRDAFGTGTVRAASLRADGSAAMESPAAEVASRRGARADDASRPIRVTLGAVSADK